MRIEMQAIGVVQSSAEDAGTKAPDRPQAIVRLYAEPRYAVGSLKVGTRILLIGWLGSSGLDASATAAGEEGVGETVEAQGGLDPSAGPSAIVLRVGRLVASEGKVLHFEGLDLAQGTLIVDLRPYHGAFGTGGEQTTKAFSRRSHLEPAVENALRRKVQDSLVDGKLPCAVAYRIAEEAHVFVGEVGQLAEDLGVRISRCQLGCFK